MIYQRYFEWREFFMLILLKLNLLIISVVIGKEMLKQEKAHQDIHFVLTIVQFIIFQKTLVVELLIDKT